MSSRGAKNIPSLCSEQSVRSAVASAAWQSHTVNVIARSVATRQSQPFFKRLPRPFRARNDIVKIYIAFILDALSTISYFQLKTYITGKTKCQNAVWVHNISDTHFSDFSTTVDNIHWESSNQATDEVLYDYKHIPTFLIACYVLLKTDLLLPLRKTLLCVSG